MRHAGQAVQPNRWFQVRRWATRLGRRTRPGGGRFSIACAAVLAAAGVTLATPPPAQACGGTFCDGAGATPMPVDQTGENVLFIQDGPAIEAHIQIQYTGEPQRFAWLIPTPTVPEFRIGSDLLFQEMLRATAPSYQYVPSFMDESCAEDYLPMLGLLPAAVLAPLPTAVVVSALALGSMSACGASALRDVGGGVSEAAVAANVVFHDSVGAFDVTVIQASTAEEVTAWLTNNDYNVPPGTLALVRQYVQENSLFAAVKLVSTARVDQIHPIVLRYDHGVPCVPLRLTAVAAAADMGVRVFFLGQNRTVPRTYNHTEVNPLRVDWLNAAANYKEVITKAVDDSVAGGHAFVTEYAGPSSVLQPINVGWWTLAGRWLSRNPGPVLQQLQEQGLMSCGNVTSRRFAAVVGVTPPDSCTFFHPLVRGLLLDYLPPPQGVTELEYWSGGAPGAGANAIPNWDADRFAADFDYRVAMPAIEAQRFLSAKPFLTRMFTTISPEEMTVDPEFHERADLPTVSNANIATTTTHCDGTTRMSLPDGRAVDIGSESKWPAFSDAMPWALRVEQSEDGQAMSTLVDRSDTVDKELAKWNAAHKPSLRFGRCACSGLLADTPPWTAGVVVALALSRRRMARRR